MKTIVDIQRERKRHPLTALREGAGLSLRDLGRHVGVAAASLHAYEQGSIPSVQNALRLAAFYETTVEDLFGYLLKEEEATHSNPCSHCHGTGFAKGNQMGELLDCPHCKGKGETK